MSNITPPVGYNTTLINTAGTTNITTHSGILGGILINTPTTGTIQISDASKTILETTGNLSIANPLFLACPATFRNLNIVTTGTVSITVFWL